MSSTTVTPRASDATARDRTERSLVVSFLSDTRAVMMRELMLVVRDPFSLIFSLVQPLVFLALFAPLLGGMVGEQGISGQSSVLQWFLPGVIVMICVFGTGMTGSNLLFEMQLGSYERILASPISRTSIIVGRSLKEFVPLVVQALVITVAAIPFGFSLHPLHVLVGLLILGLFGIGAGALSYSLAIISRKSEWMFWAVQQSVTFPLLLLSGMMLPLETGPGWMRVAAAFNPLTYVVEAERALFAGRFVDPAVLPGVVAAVVTCVVGVTIGIVAIRGATR